MGNFRRKRIQCEVPLKLMTIFCLSTVYRYDQLRNYTAETFQSLESIFQRVEGEDNAILKTLLKAAAVFLSLLISKSERNNKKFVVGALNRNISQCLGYT